MNLRDHSQPCDHPETAWFDSEAGGYLCTLAVCLGGRAVTVAEVTGTFVEAVESPTSTQGVIELTGRASGRGTPKPR